MMIKFLQPKHFLFGVLFGFILCCIAGYTVSTQARFHNFVRFLLPIQPQMHYYPTAHELLTTAEHDVDRDKILVLIGGNSIFKGIGQNPGELWSDELQKVLGDKYKVLNYAMDGATITSFGAVAFRVLSEKYSKIIFVGTCSPGVIGPVDGMEVYSYLFWDAYYKKLFHPDPIEAKKINEIRRKQIKTTKGLEQHLLSYLDSIFYYRNLWNWVGYHFVFTLWTEGAGGRYFFRSRDRFVDLTIPNLKQISEGTLKNPVYFERSKQHYNNIISNMIELSTNNLQLNKSRFSRMNQELENAFSPRYRSKILCVTTVGNPKVIAALTEKSQQAYFFMIDHYCSLLNNKGYYAMSVGKDFSSKDYLDDGHLLKSGGKKVARHVAKKIRDIATMKGYD